ncbi:MAG: TetR/AcrR family transcriptional regulator [Syntrophobacterales bacterium]|jgi:AcrR family transcriptional regulator|nr:TetR/AcrR family transcriptional regulator [Syntrophobacterales bacterium]
MKKVPAESEARQRIIQTALDLFYRQGYLATGINQVIAEAGVSKNTFYYYFPSKEDLCVAYLIARHKVWMGWLKEAIEPYQAPYDRLMSVFTFLESWLTRCNFRGCAFLNIASEVPDINHRIRKEVIAHKDELRALLRELLDDLKCRDPQFAEINPEFLTEMLYVIVEGIIGSCQIYGNTSLIAAARQNFDRLLRGAP